MSAPLKSYLRTYRKRSSFFQDEVAFLLGSVSGAKVSRYEHWARRPTMKTAGGAHIAVFAMCAMNIAATYSGAVVVPCHSNPSQLR